MQFQGLSYSIDSIIRLEKTVMTDSVALKRILSDTKTVAMVGLSGNWYRPSYFAAKYLLDRGYKVIPVNPNYQEILGQRCFPDLETIAEPIDVVDLFQRAEAVPAFVKPAIEIGAKVLWMQLGIVNEDAKSRRKPVASRSSWIDA